MNQNEWLYFYDKLTSDLIDNVLSFWRKNNYQGTNNLTVISDLENLSDFVLGVYYQNEQIIGTILIFFIKVGNINSCYTSFLNIDFNYRQQNYAPYIIEKSKEYVKKYNIHNGWYLTEKQHSINSHLINFWYRPINIRKCYKANFSMENSSKIYYHIKKPSILPILATINDFFVVSNLLSKYHNINLNKKKYIRWLNMYKIYLVNNEHLFIFFPLETLMFESKIRIYSYSLVLSNGEIFPQILWICRNDKIDLLTGYITPYVSAEDITFYKGYINDDNLYMESWYKNDSDKNDSDKNNSDNLSYDKLIKLILF